jgi:hypothetical protein
MTPKEEAKELVNKFYLERSKDNLPLTIYWTSAIGCALITVDKLLEYSKAHGFVGLTEHYEQVKIEIDKL